MQRLKKRKQYLKVARGARTSRRGFLLQALARGDSSGTTDADPARFGFTVTKKTGNAVVRNRIRRRLKEAVRLHGAGVAAPGIDLVLIGRRPALDMPFSELVADVVGAVGKAEGRNAGSRGARGKAAKRTDASSER